MVNQHLVGLCRAFNLIGGLVGVFEVSMYTPFQVWDGIAYKLTFQNIFQIWCSNSSLRGLKSKNWGIVWRNVRTPHEWGMEEISQAKHQSGRVWRKVRVHLTQEHYSVVVHSPACVVYCSGVLSHSACVEMWLSRHLVRVGVCVCYKGSIAFQSFESPCVHLVTEIEFDCTVHLQR